jgi:hypothetical protein
MTAQPTDYVQCCNDRLNRPLKASVCDRHRLAVTKMCLG